MELDEQLPTLPRFAVFRKIAEEVRSSWTLAHVRLALSVIVGVLLLEVLIAAVLYAGGVDGQFGRASQPVYAVLASLFGMTPHWAKAIFVATVHPEFTAPGFEINLRDPFQLTAEVIHDTAGIIVTWVLPIFAAIRFTDTTSTLDRNESAGKQLLRTALVAAGPLAIAAFALMSTGVLVRDVASSLASRPPDPDAYPIDRLFSAPWGTVVEVCLLQTPSILTSFLLIPTVAAVFRDRQQALAACLGTSLFAVPLLAMAVWALYPGGMQVMPYFLAVHGISILKLAMVAVMLPFALRSIRSNVPPRALESA